MRYITTVEDKQFLVEIIDEKHVSVDGKVYNIDFESVSGQPVFSLIVDGKSHEAYVQEGDENWQVLMRGRLYPVKVEDEREKRLRSAAGGGVAESGEFQLRAPMPGLVVPFATFTAMYIGLAAIVLLLLRRQLAHSPVEESSEA